MKRSPAELPGVCFLLKVFFGMGVVNKTQEDTFTSNHRQTLVVFLSSTFFTGA